MKVSDDGRSTSSDRVLLALIAALPFMNPAISFPVVLPDLVFLLLVAALGIEFLRGKRSIRWDRSNWVLVAYVASLAPSLLSSADVRISLTKIAENLYLVGLAGITAFLIDSERKLRRAISVWLAATAAMAVLAPIAVAAFYLSPDSWLMNYAGYGFGSLAPGNYPRLCLTFLNANMMCNYLTVSLGLLFIASHCRWIGRRTFGLLLAAILFAALTSISPGLGGIALSLGLCIWLTQGWPKPLAKLALWGGISAALLFIAAVAVTPFVYASAPFIVRMPGLDIPLAASGRFLTWASSARTFLHNPLIGHGIGIDPASAVFPQPDGEVELLTDAHNIFLSIAGQAGLVGLAGLAAIITLAVRATGRIEPNLPDRSAITVILGLSFLNGFVYQGLSGSFEDTRHLWVLLGLLIAASRIELTRTGENNHTAGVPSHG